MANGIQSKEEVRGVVAQRRRGNERARRARLRHDSAKSPDRNLEEGSELVRFAHEFSAAFEEARTRS